MASTVPPVSPSARIVLRHAASQLLSLTHVPLLLSDLLDAPLDVSIVDAVRTGSLWLVSRVAWRIDRLTIDDPIERTSAYADAFRVAIERGDVLVAQRLHEYHPEPVGYPLLRSAVCSRSLEMIEWTLWNRRDRLCTPTKEDYLCQSCVAGILKVEYDPSVLELFRQRGFTIHNEPAPSPSRPQTVNNATPDVIEAILNGDTDLVKRWIAEANQTPLPFSVVGHVLKAVVTAAIRRHDSVVEFMLSSSIMSSFSNQFIWKETCPGGQHVLLFKRADLLLPALVEAISQENLIMLEWLKMLWPAEVSLMFDASMMTKRLPSSRVQQLVINFYRGVKCYEAANFGSKTMDQEARNGHFEVLNWLYKTRNLRCSMDAMVEAAQKGRINVLKWIHRTHSHLCVVCCATEAIGISRHDMLDDDGAQPYSIEGVRWLLTRARRDDCETCRVAQVGRSKVKRLIKSAITMGDLILLQLLLDCFRAIGAHIELGQPELRMAIQHGHIGLVKWIYEHQRDRSNDIVLFMQRTADRDHNREISAWCLTLRGR